MFWCVPFSPFPLISGYLCWSLIYQNLLPLGRVFFLAQFEIGVSSSGYRPVNLRLAPAIKPFGLAFQSTSDSHRRSISGSAFQLNLRPSSAVRSFGQPSDQSPACAFDQSSGPAFRSTFDLRLQSTFRLHLPTGLRLASPVDRPACLPTDLQLAPLISLPVQPSSQPLDSRPPVNLRLCLQT
jgi:hypothetical protein